MEYEFVVRSLGLLPFSSSPGTRGVMHGGAGSSLLESLAPCGGNKNNVSAVYSAITGPAHTCDIYGSLMATSRNMKENEWRQLLNHPGEVSGMLGHLEDSYEQWEIFELF